MVGRVEKPITLVGKSVQDKYGRFIGHVVSVISGADGNSTSLLIRGREERFIRCDVNQIQVDGDCVVYTPATVAKALEIREKISILRQKREMLNKLYEERRIMPKAFDELQNEVEAALSRLSIDAKTIAAELERTCDDCSKQIKDLITAMACLEVEKGLGHIEEDLYKEAMRIMRKGLRQLIMEKADLETLREEMIEASRHAPATALDSRSVPAILDSNDYYPSEGEEEPVVIRIRGGQAGGEDGEREAETLHG